MHFIVLSAASLGVGDGQAAHTPISSMLSSPHAQYRHSLLLGICDGISTVGQVLLHPFPPAAFLTTRTPIAAGRVAHYQCPCGAFFRDAGIALLPFMTSSMDEPRGGHGFSVPARQVIVPASLDNHRPVVLTYPQTPSRVIVQALDHPQIKRDELCSVIAQNTVQGGQESSAAVQRG